MDKLDFVLGICAYGDITDGTFSCINTLWEETEYKFTTWMASRDALIGRSRSKVTTRFLKEHPSDILVFLDTDIIFETSDIERLIESVKIGRDVVAGGYMLANGESLALRPWEIPITIDGSVQDVEYVSTGFMAITHNALETIKNNLKLPLLHRNTDKEVYPFFESGRDTSGRHDFYISEDWDFCEKVRKSGMTVYFHSGILVGHLKRMCLRKVRSVYGETEPKEKLNG